MTEPKQKHAIQRIRQERWGCSGKIFHMESLVRLSGSGTISTSSWYDTQEHGLHLNRLTGFSTDFFQDDSLELMWRPAKLYGHFELFNFVRMGGMIMGDNIRDHYLDVVKADTPFFFSIKHYIPEIASSESDENRIATFALNGTSKKRGYGTKPGWVGWVRNLRYRHHDGAPVDIRASLDLEYNKIHD